MRRLILLAVAAAALLIPSGASALSRDQAVDQASGSGTAVGWPHCSTTTTFSFSASGGPSGENSDGTFSFDCAAASTYSPEFSFGGDVTCLWVQGSEATMSLVVTTSTAPQLWPIGTEMTWTVHDGGPAGSGDTFSTLNTANTCLGRINAPYVPLTSGDISVVDEGEFVPGSVALTPPDDVNTVGTSHTATASVSNIEGNPLSDSPVLFSVQGSVTTTGTCTTDSNGQCSFTYQGPNLPGADVITACADANGNGSVDPGEPCATATEAWLLPGMTAGHVTGGGQIPNAAGTDYDAFGFTAQSDSSGVKGECTLVDPSASVKVKCLDVTTLVESGTQATLFGDATVNGAATTYRIDVSDLAEPGAGAGMFKIQTASGYAASGVLTGGNIQVH